MLIKAKDIRQIFIFAIYYEDDQHPTIMNSVVVKLKPSNYVIKNLKTNFVPSILVQLFVVLIIVVRQFPILLFHTIYIFYEIVTFQC